MRGALFGYALIKHSHTYIRRVCVGMRGGGGSNEVTTSHMCN